MSTPAPFNLLELSAVPTSASSRLAGWLVEQGVSLALTLPTASTLLLVGVSNGGLSVRSTYAERCAALATQTSSTLYLTTRYQIWRLENALPPDQAHHDGSDRLYLPQAGFTSGNLAIEDLAVDAAGRPLFVSSLYNCVATISHRDNFAPLWRPPFIAELALGDRCHLSGLALEEGQLAYVTAAGTGDQLASWRAERLDDGVVVDVAAGAVLVQGLTLPHAPRLHHGQLWLANSGAGELARVDRQTGQAEAVARLPGYPRALALHGDFAVVGLANPPEEGIYAGLPLFQRLRDQGVQPWCGIAVVDLRSGQLVHWLQVEGTQIRELAAVAVLPGARRPRAVAAHGEEAQNLVVVGPHEPLLPELASPMRDRA